MRLDRGGVFSFLWKERGGPRVSPPTRKGFGSVILLDSAMQFGRITMNYASEGVSYELQVSLAVIEASKGSLARQNSNMTLDEVRAQPI